MVHRERERRLLSRACRHRDLGGQALVEVAGGLDQPVVSQQLAILRSKTIVTRRKAGTSVRYSVRDPLVGDLLAVARRIFNNHLVGTQGLLRELQRQGRVRQARLQ